MRLHISEEEKRIEVKRTILPFVFVVANISSFYYICPLQDQSCNRKRQINELFFSSKGKTTLLFVAFRLLVSIVQKKRRSFSKRLKGTALVNVENVFA